MTEMEGEIAWGVIDKTTQERLKDEIVSLYDGENDLTVEDIVSELGSVPIDVVTIAISELIEEGRIIENDVSLGDTLSVVRQNRMKLDIIERKTDIIAEGIVALKRLLLDIKNKDSAEIDDNIISSVNKIIVKEEEADESIDDIHDDKSTTEN